MKITWNRFTELLEEYPATIIDDFLGYPSLEGEDGDYDAVTYQIMDNDGLLYMWRFEKENNLEIDVVGESLFPVSNDKETHQLTLLKPVKIS